MKMQVVIAIFFSLVFQSRDCEYFSNIKLKPFRVTGPPMMINSSIGYQSNNLRCVPQKPNESSNIRPNEQNLLILL